MTVYFFTFSKKKNSTAQPSLSAGTLFTVNLKEDCSIMNPVLVMTATTTGMPNPFTPAYFNYAYIQKFSRYYYITDVQYVLGHWEFYLTVDVLASYKTGIGSLSEYILRSSSSYNGYISDTLYPTHTNLSRTVNTVSLNLNLTGFYCVGVISNDSAASQGAITYYYLTDAQFGTLKNYLLSETFLTDNGLAALADIDKNLVKVLYNPYQYIVSCKFFPIPFPGVGSDEYIKFGWWTLTTTGRKMNAGGYVTNVVSANIPIPAHPQASSRGSYLNHSPYTERYIIHPLIGTVLLDSNKIDAGDTVNINFSVDVITGEATVSVIDSTQNTTLYQSVFQLAVDIPLAQINSDVLGMARTAIDSVGNVANNVMSLNLGGAIASAASGVLNTLEASIPILQSSAVSSNMSMYGINVQSVNIFRQLVNEDNSHRGRPLCAVATINTLSGYILCADAHAEISCLDSERSEIVNYMNTGFYYE